jgi:AcrR family transcriptional regulator
VDVAVLAGPGGAAAEAGTAGLSDLRGWAGLTAQQAADDLARSLARAGAARLVVSRWTLLQLERGTLPARWRPAADRAQVVRAMADLYGRSIAEVEVAWDTTCGDSAGTRSGGGAPVPSAKRVGEADRSRAKAGRGRAERRAGRRPGGTDTRDRILAAARSEFAANGYDGTSIRGIARAAEVDPALVLYYFGSKDQVFIAALDLPLDPVRLLPYVLTGDKEGLGERMVRMFLGVWEASEGRDRMLGLIRAAITNETVADLFRGFLTRELLARIAAELEVDDPRLRETLAISQLVGMAVLRYVIKIEPLASTDVETLVAHLAPAVQRHLVQG